MKTNWPVRPVNRSTSSWTCSGVKATKSTTASNSRSPIAARADAGSRMSPSRRRASAGSGRADVRPRLRTYRSIPRSTARCEQAELICPEPPTNKTFRAVMAADRSQRGCGWKSSTRLPAGSITRTWSPPTRLHELAAQTHAGRAQPLDLASHVGDLERDAVPAAGLRAAAVREHLTAPAPLAGRAEQQPQGPVREDREGRRRMHRRPRSPAGRRRTAMAASTSSTM